MLLYIIGFGLIYLYYKYTQQDEDEELPFDILYSFSNDLSRKIISNKLELNKLKYLKNDTDDFTLCDDIVSGIICKNKFLNLVQKNELNSIQSIKLLIYTYNNSVEDIIVEYLIKYCKINNIILYIVSELHPNEFNFDINNYITPYHYRLNFFGYYDRIYKYNNDKSSIKLSEIRNNIINNYTFDNKEILIVL